MSPNPQWSTIWPPLPANLAAITRARRAICIDDFARGVSSLSLLRRLPSTRCASTARRSTRSPPIRMIAPSCDRSSPFWFREIGLTATADGVETGAQAECPHCAGMHPSPGPPVLTGPARSGVRHVPRQGDGERFEQQVSSLSLPPTGGTTRTGRPSTCSDPRVAARPDDNCPNVSSKPGGRAAVCIQVRANVARHAAPCPAVHFRRAPTNLCHHRLQDHSHSRR